MGGKNGVGEREGEDHLRQRISCAGLGENNRGVMRILIDIRRESRYGSRETEREREALRKKSRARNNQGKVDPVWLTLLCSTVSHLRDAKPLDCTSRAALHNRAHQG